MSTKCLHEAITMVDLIYKDGSSSSGVQCLMCGKIRLETTETKSGSTKEKQKGTTVGTTEGEVFSAKAAEGSE